MISFVINAYAVDAARKRLRESLLIGEARRVDAMAQQVEETLLSVTADLLVLGQLITGNLAADIDGNALASVMTGFADTHKVYDQLRFIDESGKEVIRVNNLEDGATLVAKARLQDKSGSNYVLAAQKIKRDTVLVTPIELNREFGKVEIPIKPVMRFLTPVFNDQGVREGTVVINFKVAYVLDSLMGVGRTTLSHPLVLNGEGGVPLGRYGPEQTDAAAALGAKEPEFAEEYPAAWEAMRGNSSGFISDGFGGTVTYQTVTPSLLSGQKRFLQPVVWAMPLDIDGSGPQVWYFVSHVHASDLDTFISIAQVRSPEIEVLLGAMMVILAWILALRIVGLRSAASRLRRVSTHDHLTGLLNRAEFENRLSVAVSHAQRFNRPMAVLFLDLDGFKRINDTMGHAAGDDLLRQVGSQLRKSVRESDVVARLGGDEFSVILSEIRSPFDTFTVIDYIKAKLAEPMQLKTSETNIGVSIGAANFPEDADDAESLLDAADQAMYTQKAR